MTRSAFPTYTSGQDGWHAVPRSALDPDDACFQDPLGDIDTWQDEIDGLHAGARVTADGRYLAFTSDSTTLDPSYNNVIRTAAAPQGGLPLRLQQPGTGPICVSCVGAGAPSTDSTINSQELTTQSNDLVNYPDWEKQNLLPNGTLYFESGEKLAPADHNRPPMSTNTSPAGDAVADVQRAEHRAVELHRRDGRRQQRLLHDRPVAAAVRHR